MLYKVKDKESKRVELKRFTAATAGKIRLMPTGLYM